MTASDVRVAFTAPSRDGTRPTLTGTFGMSASTHWLATGTAQSVLERGGNAVDAAVAASFVLHAVEPHLNGPGGDLVGIIAPAGSAPFVLCGQGPAPAAADVARLRAEGLDVVPGAGALAAAVPGAVAALLWLLAEHGTWELPDVLAYAVDQLEHGHPASAQLCRVIDLVAEMFRDDWPTSAAGWLPDGRAPVAGELVRNPVHAATLRRLADAARQGATRAERIHAASHAWRRGFVADALAESVRYPHRHATGGLHAGLLTGADLAAFRVTTERPLTLDFRGTTVAKPGFWTQGPVLLQALAILDHLPDERLDPSTAVGIHTIAEALKLAMADRDTYYGDGAEGLTALLDPGYAAARAALIGEAASAEFRPGALPGLHGHRPPLRRDDAGPVNPATGEPTVARNGETRGDTCHLDVVDRRGTMVSLTPSGGWLQSSPTVASLGFCLGTRLQMSWLDEESPAALRPGRRPRTTLSPTLLLRDGEPVAALGTPGGDQQDQWQLLYLLRVLVGGYRPQEAIDAPAFHTTSLVSSFWPRTWSPAGLVVEAGSVRTCWTSSRSGYYVTVAPDWSLGRLSTVDA